MNQNKTDRKVDRDGLSHREIAQKVGLSFQSVAKIERRAMLKLRFFCEALKVERP